MAIFIPKWNKYKSLPNKPVEINWNSGYAVNLVGALSAHNKNYTVAGTCGLVTGMFSNEPIQLLKGDGASLLSAKLIRPIGSAASFIYFGHHDYSQSNISAGIGTSSAGSQFFGLQSQYGVLNFRAVIRLVDAGGISTAETTSIPADKDTDAWSCVYDGTTTLKLYKNGGFLTPGVTLTGASGAATSLDLVCLGGINRGTDTYATTGTNSALIFAFDKAISAEEVKELSEYPGQLLKQRNQFFFLGSANESADIALTTVNPTISIGASQLQHTDVAITTTNPTIAAELSQTLHADVAITTVNPTIAATVNETVALASVALTTQNPIISARITGGEPDFVLGGVPLHSEVKRGKRRWETDEEYEAEYNENIPVDNPIIKLDGSVTKIKESMDHAKKQDDKKDEDDVKAIVQFVKEYRSNIISTWLN